MSVGEGADSIARSLYPFVREHDDGTWWEAIQPGASGYAMVPWLAMNWSPSDIHDILNGYGRVPGLHYQRYVPAFVKWRACTHDDGLVVDIDEYWCYDNVRVALHCGERWVEGVHDPEDWVRNRSVFFNAIVTNTTGLAYGGDTEITMPVWAIAPVDTGWFNSWLDEALEHWARSGIGDRQEDAYSYLCYCAGFEAHIGTRECCRSDSYGDFDDTCSSVRVDHDSQCTAAGPTVYVDDCENLGCEEVIDDRYCDCGMVEVITDVGNAIERTADCSSSICTDSELFIATWAYALESYYRGWQACYDLTRGKHDWFSSLFQRLSPFAGSPGQPPLVQGLLPHSTSSSTPLAS